MAMPGIRVGGPEPSIALRDGRPNSDGSLLWRDRNCHHCATDMPLPPMSSRSCY